MTRKLDTSPGAPFQRWATPQRVTLLRRVYNVTRPARSRCFFWLALARAMRMKTSAVERQCALLVLPAKVVQS